MTDVKSAPVHDCNPELKDVDAAETKRGAEAPAEGHRPEG